MPSAPRPRRLVHATYPTGRCAGCDRRLVRSTEAVQGEFPLPTSDQLLVIRCRVCAECLADPELRSPQTLRRFALGILRRLWLWYAPRLSASHGRESCIGTRRQPRAPAGRCAAPTASNAAP
jgi:hypothetical protein